MNFCSLVQIYFYSFNNRKIFVVKKISVKSSKILIVSYTEEKIIIVKLIIKHFSLKYKVEKNIIQHLNVF